MSSAMLAPESQ
uniref:Dolichyl-diphosphooligosaccharideprotein glycosyltransferase subunit DAD1 n=1 Tax=Rhizophora mucronata TaxID=61149 RepID=A0A2P2KTS5_RHIMU